MSAIGEAVSFKLYHPGAGRLVTEQEFKHLQSSVNVEKEIEEAEKAMCERLESQQSLPQEPVEKHAKGWLHKFIESTNGVTLRKLILKMQEREYSQSLINRQIEMIEKDYEFDGEIIVGIKSGVNILKEDEMAKVKAKKATKKGKVGRGNSHADKTFVATVKENPYREESARGKAMAKLIKAGAAGLPYSKELKDGNCLNDGLHKGFIKIKA